MMPNTVQTDSAVPSRAARPTRNVAPVITRPIEGDPAGERGTEAGVTHDHTRGAVGHRGGTGLHRSSLP